jgi:hypothetical protein
MHELIKAGLNIMRDPNTGQEFGQERDNEGHLCALGCFGQAAVDAGEGEWVNDGGDWFVVPIGELDAYSPPEALRKARGELSSVVSVSRIIRMNDDDRAPLPQIADVIEAAYAEKEGGV